MTTNTAVVNTDNVDFMNTGWNGISPNTTYTSNLTHAVYDYWHTCWPTYIHSCSCGVDKGKQAYALAKTLIDKKLVQVKTVKDFCNLMDTLIQAL